MIVLENDFLYVVVYTVTFDMQYWPHYSRGPLNVNTMSNLVFIRQRGNYFQHFQQSVNLQHLSIHDKVFPHKQLQKLSLSKFARNGLWGSTRWIFLQTCFYHLVHPVQSLSIISVNTRMVMYTNVHNKITIPQGRNVTNNKKRTCTTSRLTKCKVFAKDACVCFIKHYKIKQEWFGCVSFPIPFIMDPILDLVCTCFIGTKRLPTQSTFWHFTPRGRLFILMLLLLHQGWPSNVKSIPST